MVECATDTVGWSDGATVAAGEGPAGKPHRSSTKANALVARCSEPPNIAKLGEPPDGRDHVLGVTLGLAGVDLEVVAGTGRDVLDLQRSHHRTAPLAVGVTADFREAFGAAPARPVAPAGTAVVFRTL